MDTVNQNVMNIPGKFYRNPKLAVGNNICQATCYEGSFSEALRHFKERPEIPQAHANHKEFMEEHVYGSNQDSWKGGSFEALIEPHRNFKNYHDTIKRVQNDKLWKQVIFSFDKQMQRRRTRDAYDGDFDYDKRWDAEPYQHRTRKPQVVRTVKITVEGAFSCSVKADAINQFGAFVAAVTTMLERNGVLVALKVTYTVNGLTDKHVGRVEFGVKRPDEYLPPSALLKCLSSNFYRRVAFAAFIATAENIKQTVNINLGTCIQMGKVWERKDDEIFIYGIPSYDEQHSIAENLVKFIANNEQGESKNADPIPF